jgi:outer membrane immunogenic protein
MEFIMKKILVSGVAALAALSSGIAFAADLPSRRGVVSEPPIVRAPVFTWTGFYAGVNGGYSFGGFTGTAAPLLRDPAGFTGGGQIGYNHQIGQFVIGVETDLQFSDVKGGGTAPIARGRLDYFGTLRARGGIAFDRAFIYATAGYAYGNAKVTQVGGLTDANFHNGWTAGAGIEYALGQNLSLKGEYLYTSLEKKTFFAPGTTGGLDFHTVRAGVNYRF